MISYQAAIFELNGLFRCRRRRHHHYQQLNVFEKLKNFFKPIRFLGTVSKVLLTQLNKRETLGSMYYYRKKIL